MADSNEVETDPRLEKRTRVRFSGAENTISHISQTRIHYRRNPTKTIDIC